MTETETTEGHRPYRRGASKERPLRHEWVSLEDGDICVRALKTNEVLMIGDIAARPKIDRRGGLDPSTSAVWHVLYSCYEDEGPEARPIWPQDATGVAEVMALPAEEFGRLTRAIQRVNGTGKAEIEEAAAFFGLTPAPTS